MFKTKYTQKYTNKQSQVKFLLGGIGTGNISIASNGKLTDFEVFGSSNKGFFLPYTFVSTHYDDKKGTIINKIVESDIIIDNNHPQGYASNELVGLPRFNKTKMNVRYPFCNIDFLDDKIPVKYHLETYTPFIPTNEDDSGIPGFYMNYTVDNPLDYDVEVSLCFSIANFVGFDSFDPRFRNASFKAEINNKYYEDEFQKGIIFSSDKLDKNDVTYGNCFLSTNYKDISYKVSWVDGAWWDGAHDFWNQFSEKGEIYDEIDTLGKESQFNGKTGLRIGSICIKKTIKAHSKEEYPFIFTWYFPNRLNRWDGHLLPTNKKGDEIIKKYYSYRFKDSIDVSTYLLKNCLKLKKDSMNFTKALYNSSIPNDYIDRIASNITTIRSNTCFRIGKEGTFLAWEGCFDSLGSCEGNCTHVWNYEQTLAFLFPRLEQMMQKISFLHETREDGFMNFRCNSPFDDPAWDFIPATDGQLGEVCRLYRDWLLSGDNSLIDSMFPYVKKSLEFAKSYWDSDSDNVLDSRQHNTYDIEFFGPNCLSNSIYFTALRAASEMAKYVGDMELSKKYIEMVEEGSKKLDKLLFNGEYYIQKIDNVNEFKYQYGKGCLSDQVFGDLLAHLYNLPSSLPKENVKKAVSSIYKYNYRNNMYEHENVQRTYAANNDGGLLLCSWPKGGRPRLPFVYADEVWAGIEYQVASHLIYNGMIDEANNIVHSIMGRYDGYKRNPFSETECGYHYARSLASYGLLVAYSGYKYDLRNNIISFNPVIKGDFDCFFSCAKGFGIYHKRVFENNVKEWIEPLYGNLSNVKLVKDIK